MLAQRQTAPNESLLENGKWRLRACQEVCLIWHGVNKDMCRWTTDERFAFTAPSVMWKLSGIFRCKFFCRFSKSLKEDACHVIVKLIVTFKEGRIERKINFILIKWELLSTRRLRDDNDRNVLHVITCIFHAIYAEEAITVIKCETFEEEKDGNDRRQHNWDALHQKTQRIKVLSRPDFIECEL